MLYPQAADRDLERQLADWETDGGAHAPAEPAHPGEPPLKRELTYRELDALPYGTTLFFTNWPGTPAIPVVKVRHPDGNVVTGRGKVIAAFPDELTRGWRRGLEDHE